MLLIISKNNANYQYKNYFELTKNNDFILVQSDRAILVELNRNFCYS